MSLPKRIEITEVGPRDGWQNHKAMIIPTEVKAKYVKKMIDAGADKIEVTSFVNPKAVPQMANAKDLVALVQPYAKEKGCQTIGLALNKRGVDDAVAAGVDYVGFGISVSEEHNKRNSNRKKINFDVCGLSFKHFVLFFAVVFASAYLGFMPTVTIYSNSAGAFTATTFVGSVAFLMAVGGVFFWLGNTIPILNNYLGGACLLPLLGASLMNYLGLVPEPLANGVRMVMKGGFQDMYVAMLLIGSVLVMDRKLILSATARYLPTIIGSQVFALGFCMIGGAITGFGAKEGLFYIGAPCMSGGSAGAITTLPSLYSALSGQDMTGMAGQFLCYASIANILAVLMAAVGGAVTAKMSGWNGGGRILVSQSAEELKEEKRAGTSADYKKLGSGIFMSLVIYLLGEILGKLPGTSVIAGLAWSIIIAIVIKCTGILSDDIADNCVYSMNFALKALLPMLVAGIGINSLKITDLTKFFSPGVFAVIFFGVLGAFIGAMIFAKLAGLFPYEAGVTAGLCCCNIGGSGDLAVLTAADRMNLLAFASISTRIGGALMVVWLGFLYPLLMK